MFGMVDLKINEVVDDLNTLKDRMLQSNATIIEKEFADRRLYQGYF